MDGKSFFLRVAVYNGETGGTRNTIAYANKNKVEVLNVLEG